MIPSSVTLYLFCYPNLLSSQFSFFILTLPCLSIKCVFSIKPSYLSYLQSPHPPPPFLFSTNQALNNSSSDPQAYTFFIISKFIVFTFQMNCLNYINTLNILISMLLTLPKNHTKLCYVINQLFIKLKVNIHFYFYINSVKLLLRIHLVRYILVTTFDG